jgi:hypothetical protein
LPADAEGGSLTSLLRELCLRKPPVFVGETVVETLRGALCLVGGDFDFEVEGRTVLFDDDVEDSRTGARRNVSSFDALLALNEGRRFCGLGMKVLTAEWLVAAMLDDIEEAELGVAT